MIQSIKNILGRARNLYCFYTNKARKIYITEAMMWLYRWRKPVRPYAFIRVHNEIKTIDVCLKSILPVVKGGVIGFHHSDEEDDGTREYVLAFCKKYPQFVPAEYPHKVLPPRHLGYKDKDLDIRRRLDSYYNFVWDKLPKNEWIMKVDCDHIFNAKYVEDLCRLPIRKNDAVLMSRINLHCFDGKIYVKDELGIQEPGDHWIVYNGDLIPQSPFDFYFVDNGVEYRAREDFKYVWDCNLIYGILSNWHFLRVKVWRSVYGSDGFNLLNINLLYKIGGGRYKGRLPADMIDEKNILKNYKKFNLEDKKMLP